MQLTVNMLSVVAAEIRNASARRFTDLLAVGGDFDIWKLAFILLVGLLVLGGAVLAYRWFNRSSRSSAAFLTQAVRMGLTREEQDVLRLVAQMAELRNVQAIFTLEEVFHTGSHKLLQSPRVKAMTPQGQQYIGSLLNSVQEKLGFRTGDGDSRVTTTRQIPEGSKLYITHRTRMESFDAIVQKITLMNLELLPAVPVEIEEGDRWLARFCDGASIWEFDVTSLTPSGTQLLLEHTNDIRFVNRRRFPRVPVDRAAFVAPFSFDKPDVAAPMFLPARLVELAGAGLRFQAPLSMEIGQRALVVAQLGEGRNIQAMGKVRRCSDAGGGEFSLVVELVALTSGEIDILAQETAQAAQARVKLSDGGSPAHGADAQADAWKSAQPQVAERA